MLPQPASKPSEGKSTYICPIDPETSVHTLSISSLSLSRAKACKVGSGSERKPTKPAADVRAGIVVTDVLPHSGSCKYVVAWDARWVAMALVAADRGSCRGGRPDGGVVVGNEVYV